MRSPRMLRDEIAARGSATFALDLLPARSAEQVLAEVAHPRGSRSLSSHLKSRLSLDGIKMALLHELLPKPDLHDAARLAGAIKALPITVVAARPIDEAISTAGGVRFEALDDGLMLREVPGVFCAGEMLDWEAPTGGYLLTASFATGTRGRARGDELAADAAALELAAVVEHRLAAAAAHGDARAALQLEADEAAFGHEAGLMGARPILISTRAP